ncbi:unnamed protein product [Ambrosiozyma monospora]|uniref:Unnamed protein product n=1 Tax=Ambrosiozyma monospora TaxID=43982 RepID=A0A9W7DI90_AMBMO|nr:unnamed protein product [Ambrosiozyma monospora]
MRFLNTVSILQLLVAFNPSSVLCFDISNLNINGVPDGSTKKSIQNNIEHVSAMHPAMPIFNLQGQDSGLRTQDSGRMFNPYFFEQFLLTVLLTNKRSPHIPILKGL